MRDSRKAGIWNLGQNTTREEFIDWIILVQDTKTFPCIACPSTDVYSYPLGFHNDGHSSTLLSKPCCFVLASQEQRLYSQVRCILGCISWIFANTVHCAQDCKNKTKWDDAQHHSIKWLAERSIYTGFVNSTFPTLFRNQYCSQNQRSENPT